MTHLAKLGYNAPVHSGWKPPTKIKILSEIEVGSKIAIFWASGLIFCVQQYFFSFVTF